MSPEEAAALAAQAAAADALVAPAGIADAGEAGQDEPSMQERLQAGFRDMLPDNTARLAELRQENLDLLEMGIEMIEPVLPIIRAHYTPQVCGKIAARGADLELKYGISLPELFGKYKEEIMFAVVTVPPSVQLIMATRAYIAEQHARAAEAEAKKKGAQKPLPADGAQPAAAPA